MNDEEKIRAECMAEINANPGKPYEVVTRDDLIITVKNHGLGGDEPIVGVFDNGEVHTFTSGGQYIAGFEDGLDIMGFAPKKPRELVLHRWVTEAQLLQAQTEKTTVPLLRYTEEKRNVPVTIIIREGHDD